MTRLRWPNRSAVEFAIKAGLATVVSVGLSRWIGLNSPYWAGISAVVATAGSLGASVNASITRIVATLIALVIAIGVVLLPFDNLLIAGLTVSVTLLVMSALRLDAGARLAGASTLLLTAIPGDDPLSVAIGRGLNVPLGCVIAVLVGLVLFPHRAVDDLRSGLTTDLKGSLRLAADAVACWMNSAESPQIDELDPRLQQLLSDVRRRDQLFTEATFEPGGMGRQTQSLAKALELTKRMSRVTRSLVIVASRGTDDSAQQLLETEFRAVIDAIERSSALIDDALWQDSSSLATSIHTELSASLTALDAGFRRLRESRATAPYSDRDVEHLLHAMWCVHALDEAFVDHID